MIMQGPDVSFATDDHGGPMAPEIVVIHYAVTETADATSAALKARDYVSCHVTVDSSGKVVQMVPFNRIAWHAGKSDYHGRQDVNGFAVGIEVSNPGPLVTGPDGRLRTT